MSRYAEISEIIWPIELKFSMNTSKGGGNEKLCKWFLAIWPRWPQCPYMVTPLNIFFLGLDI